MLNKSLLHLAQGQKIGLLGGSFNPPHNGHLHIINLAIKHLKLHKVCCLVSPQNPLKDKNNMAPLSERIKQARKLFRGSCIEVTDIEVRLSTQYTIDTVKALKNLYKGVRFVWIMGADNLIQINKWQNWEQIFKALPIAIFDRPPYSLRAEKSVASQKFMQYRLPSACATDLVNMGPPAWIYMRTGLNKTSSTQIRLSSNKSNLNK